MIKVDYLKLQRLYFIFFSILHLIVDLELMSCFVAETISKFGSGLFLLVQVVLLLDFVHAWNENWVSKDEQFWCVCFSFLF